MLHDGPFACLYWLDFEAGLAYHHLFLVSLTQSHLHK